MASRMERKKAAREYGRLERVAPSPALQLADNELSSELYPYLKNRPMAKLGLDVHLFEAGKIKPKDFKQRLLGIKTNYKQFLNLAKNEITSILGKYTSDNDVVVVNKGAEYPRLLVKKDGKDYVQTGKYSPRKGRTETIIHELAHRGYQLLDQLVPEDYRGPQSYYYEHTAMTPGDIDTANQLGIHTFAKEGLKEQRANAYTKKRLKQAAKENPYITTRYPSMKNSFRLGGKVYTNNVRKAKTYG